MKQLLEPVERSIRERQLLRRGEEILVAVSGGLDSMALLHLLHALAPTFRWHLTVAHFNHRLRGRSSLADEQLVKRTAQKLGLRFAVGSGDVKRHARGGLSIEMAARELRHEFLAKTARRLKIRTVALAHHANDQVELFFLRLLRGAGGEGLSGMKWRSPSPVDSRLQLVRPLLNIARVDLEKYVRERRVRFREDASNASLDHQRNLIRHELLPLLRARFQPALDKVVLRAMDIVGADAEAVIASAQAALKAKGQKLDDCPVGVQRRVLYEQLHAQGIVADFDLVEALRLKPGCAVSIGARQKAVCDKLGKVQLIDTSTPKFASDFLTLNLDYKPAVADFQGVQFKWQSGHLPKRLAAEPGCERFDAEKVGRTVILRHWRVGDRFHPIGMPKPVKLQDWFTNRKVPRAERHRLIVATTANERIFWVEGQRIDERFKLDAATGKCLIWRWQRR